MIIMIEIFNLDENNLRMKSINLTKHFVTRNKQIKVKYINRIQAWTGLEVSRRFRLPDFSRHMKVKKLPGLRTSRVDPSRKFCWHSFLPDTESFASHSADGSITSIKNSNDT